MVPKKDKAEDEEQAACKKARGRNGGHSTPKAQEPVGKADAEEKAKATDIKEAKEGAKPEAKPAATADL